MSKQTYDKGLCTIITYIANILPKITKNVALYKLIKVLKILWGVLVTGDAYQIDLSIFLRCTLCSCQCRITMSRGWTPHPWNFCLRRRKQTPGCLGEQKADQGNTGWLLLCTAVLGEGKSLNFIMVTVVQLYKHSENHWNKHFTWKDYGMHALYLSKALKSS